jgi:hypothetical protein
MLGWQIANAIRQQVGFIRKRSAVSCGCEHRPPLSATPSKLHARKIAAALLYVGDETLGSAAWETAKTSAMIWSQ